MLDLVSPTGQIALALNLPLKRTWENITHLDISRVSAPVLETIFTRHESDLWLISSPTCHETTNPIPGGARLSAILSTLETGFEYIVADLPHDFGERALPVLQWASEIVLVTSPRSSFHPGRPWPAWKDTGG